MAITFLKIVLFLTATVLMGRRCFTTTPNTGGRGVTVTWSLPRLAQAAAVLVGLLVVYPAVGFVEAGHRGVVLRFGAVTDRVLDEGIYIIKPVIESVEEMDVQIHAVTATASGASRDLQIVSTEVTLNYSLKPESVAHTYQSLRRDYVQRIIAPAIQEAVKAATAQFDAEKLIVERPKVRDALQLMLTERLETHGMHIDAMSLTDFRFSDDFNHAIEAKVTATQKALQAHNDLQRIEIEAQQRVAQATAEAEAIRIQAESISKQGGANYVALKWIEKWNGNPPQIMTGGSDSQMLFQVPNQ